MIECNQKDSDKTWVALKAQISRLGQMRGYPREPPALRELVLALRTASTLEQATGVITALLEQATTETWCPMPGDIQRVCNALRLPFLPDPACGTCDGSGWRIVERGGLSGADRCTCWARRPAPEYGPVRLEPPEPARSNGMRSVAEISGGAK